MYISYHKIYFVLINLVSGSLDTFLYATCVSDWSLGPNNQNEENGKHTRHSYVSRPYY